MPFKSARQRRFLYARHPEIARRWTAEEKAVSKSLVEIRKAALDLEDVDKAFGGKKVVAAGLTGALALGGGAGAVKAAPKIGQGIRGVRNTLEYKGTAATGSDALQRDIVSRANAQKPVGSKLASDATGRQITGSPGGGFRPVMTKDEWLAAGKPSHGGDRANSGGLGGVWNPGSVKTQQPGTTLYARSLGPGKGFDYSRTLNPRTRGD